MKWLQSTFANRYHRFRKVRVASVLKRKTSAPSTWIAERLNMGAPQLVSVYVNRLRRELAEQPNPDYDKFILKYTE